MLGYTVEREGVHCGENRGVRGERASWGGVERARELLAMVDRTV